MKLSFLQVKQIKAMLQNLQYEIDTDTFRYIERIIVDVEKNMTLTRDEYEDILKVLDASFFYKSKIKSAIDFDKDWSEIQEPEFKHSTYKERNNHFLINEQNRSNVTILVDYLKSVLFPRTHVFKNTHRR